MHKEILSKEQVELLPFLKKVSKDFGLVGGTAIAFHLGHRKSIDFDFFSYKEFNHQILKKNISKIIIIDQVLVSRSNELTFFSNKVKITFFNYPHIIPYKDKFENIIKIPDLLTLAAMKAYALGQRAKWKDYVDLYYIIKDFHSVDVIMKQGVKLFKKEFNPKIFRTQLSYFDDINYQEKITFLPGFKVDEKEVKKKMIEFSLGI
ncbi:MAG: nucleotidyl transferase AbiEii/AbiGii toxin family protein [Patescibacteria group bacterium]|nr:nucleotidyl transferase AbiEii/AbiGii toxin family protein [Patescibacteria group bacterium]